MKNAQAAQEHRVDMEEVDREDRLGLGSRNAPQVCPDRRGAGSMPASFRTFHTVDGASSCPRPVSSP
ncbi:MAG TPA: hypothetical protein VGG83_17915 [Trebonia sp.]|jgi:hypothetical protein